MYCVILYLYSSNGHMAGGTTQFKSDNMNTACIIYVVIEGWLCQTG